MLPGAGGKMGIPLKAILVGLLAVPIVLKFPVPARTQQLRELSVQNKNRAAVQTPEQILYGSRGSIVVIVAAGNTTQKLGTGFYVQSTGLLLTNFHVVEGAENVGVKTKEASTVLSAKKAKGFDVDNDLVALEVETGAAKPVVMGDSDQVRVGEQIVVIGNPEGLEQTISNGLISGIRELDGRKLFQISAPISEGSSGSPVFNERGEVIGVVVASLESGQNLNFAVPINYAKPLLTSPTETLISSLPRHSSSATEAANVPNDSGAQADVNDTLHWISNFVNHNGYWSTGSGEILVLNGFVPNKGCSITSSVKRYASGQPSDVTATMSLGDLDPERIRAESTGSQYVPYIPGRFDALVETTDESSKIDVSVVTSENESSK